MIGLFVYAWSKGFNSNFVHCVKKNQQRIGGEIFKSKPFLLKNLFVTKITGFLLGYIE